MLNSALIFLRNYLRDNIVFEGLDIDVRYLPSKNAAFSEDPNQIHITLLSIEEERSAKPPYRQERRSDSSPARYELFNPDLALNLYIMISSSGDYGEALKNISRVITTFANKSIFEKPDFENALTAEENIDHLSQLSLDIQNFSLDQTNNLWQALANNIIPHIIYKVRMLIITPTVAQGETTEVRQVAINAKTI
jgi:hypothetical protein